MGTSISFKEVQGVTNVILALDVQVKKKGDWYFAYGENLKTSGYSKESREAAAHDLFLNAIAFLDYHGRKGSLISILKKLGWIILDSHKYTPKRPVVVISGEISYAKKTLTL